MTTLKPAIGYTRISSQANVDGDSETRQRGAIEAFGVRHGYAIVQWVSDPAVSGADAIEARPGFAAALERIAGNGVDTIIVETANRFARDLMVQEAGYHRLKADGITLIAADHPDQFTDDSPTAVLIRQILGAVAQFDKAMTVAKLRGARLRKRQQTGKCEGRKGYADKKPEIVALAAKLRVNNSLRKTAAELAARGHTDCHGQPFSPAAIRSMLGARRKGIAGGRL
jgi:DNA invertase Pin-like site-specific DNA recombinase